jgi:hypothetical protein
MPQLDITTFLLQILPLIIVLYILYMLVKRGGWFSFQGTVVGSTVAYYPLSCTLVSLVTFFYSFYLTVAEQRLIPLIYREVRSVLYFTDGFFRHEV